MTTACLPRLDVYSDVICPWCYIGKRHMEGALASLASAGQHFAVAWRPFQLNPDMPAEGVARESYRLAKFGSLDRSRELDAQVAAAAEAAGLPIHLDRIRRTPNTLDAHRLIQFAAEQEVQASVVDRLFAAYFVEGRDIGATDVLVELARDAGLDAAAFLDGDRLAAEVAAEDAAVRRAGLNGVPTFVLDRHILFSGAVPSDTFAEALLAAKKVLSGSAR